MTGSTQGFAPVFVGWNVWNVYQAADPDESLLGAIWHAGISQDQLLKLWVENQLEDNAPGVNVSDPVNPNPEHFRGDEVQIIPSTAGLKVAVGRESIPDLAGALQVGNEGSAALLRSVRFYNRGRQTMLPWPHDRNFVLDAVYMPDPSNAITNSPAPKTAGGELDAAGKALGHALETAAWVLGGAVALYAIVRATRK